MRLAEPGTRPDVLALQLKLRLARQHEAVLLKMQEELRLELDGIRVDIRYFAQRLKQIRSE